MAEQQCEQLLTGFNLFNVTVFIFSQLTDKNNYKYLPHSNRYCHCYAFLSFRMLLANSCYTSVFLAYIKTDTIDCYVYITMIVCGIQPQVAKKPFLILSYIIGGTTELPSGDQKA